VRVLRSGSHVKNFPHQYNDLRKLRSTLEIVRDLRDAGSDADDDGILGYELARRRVYGFRGFDYTGDDAAVDERLASRIVEEQAKPSGKQGARTAAREMRRTLRYLGWLDQAGEVTPAGEAVLASVEGSDEELILMQQAIASIAVEDRDGHRSHPVQILLRLIDDVALYSRDGMELALEAKDDSTVEFRRIVELAGLADADRERALKALGWTASQLANAVKILPAFAQQSGLITADGTGQIILTDAGRRAVGRAGGNIATPPPGERPPRRVRRRSTAVRTRNAKQVGQPRRLLAAERRVLTPEEQARAAELLYERTERHQELVRDFAQACVPAEFFEDAAAYDLVVDLDSVAPVVLTEVKTIAGDAESQLRSAVGQLTYYEYFAVRNDFPGRDVRKLAVVDDHGSGELADYLQANGIGLIARVDGKFVALNELGEDLATDLFG
jgi:hypothetical protein